MKTKFRKDSKDVNYRGITPAKFRRLNAQGKIKARYDLIPWWSTHEEAMVLTYGGLRYGEYNWQGASRQDMMHYYGAIQRHLAEIRSGNLFDKDTGLRHTAHIRANTTFLEDYQRKYQWF